MRRTPEIWLRNFFGKGIIHRENSEQDFVEKTAKRVLKHCRSTASSIKSCYEEVYNKSIPDFYLATLFDTALEEAVFSCFYRDEEAEDPTGITSIPLA